MPRASLCAFAVLLLAAGYAAGAAAALYKWTDAQGRIVYSDQPPQANVKTELLRRAPPPANPNAATDLAQRLADCRQRQADAQKAAAKAGERRRGSAGQAASGGQAQGRPRQPAQRH